MVSVSDVPAEVLEKERAIEMEKEDLKSKPEAIRWGAGHGGGQGQGREGQGRVGPMHGMAWHGMAGQGRAARERGREDWGAERQRQAGGRVAAG